ncbi:MAG: hypothetical protein M3Q56_03095 [Bacteroidota bacterium]|nr:hypothetical protein [Bacteroidota bacterium]
MKSIRIFLVYIAIQTTMSGQEIRNHLLDQFFLSINRSNEYCNSCENRFGYGVGVYHTFQRDSRMNFLSGLEFNRTIQFAESVTIGHFGGYENVTYSKNCISIPFTVRLPIAAQQRIFAEAGGFWDWVINSTIKGVVHSFVPDGSGQIQNKYFEIKEDAGFVNSFGVSFGLGIRIPGNRYDFIIKPDIKFKFNRWNFDIDRRFTRYFRLNAGVVLK